MARWQLFIPNDVAPKGTAQTPEAAMSKVGLEAFANGADTIDCVSGPEGQPGRVFAWVDPKQIRTGYKPDQQTWIPSATDGDLASGSYHIGIWNDSPPTEQDLRRKDCRRGRHVVMGNGESWIVTTPDHLDRFPQLNPDGSISWCVDTEFNWLTQDLDRRKQECVQRNDDGDGLTITFDLEADWRFLSRLIAVNYRVTPEVVSHLRLFSLQSIRETMAALMDMVLKG